MQKFIVFICVCIFAIVNVSISHAESEYLNISEIKSQVYNLWDEEYPTKWRTIHINTNILIPEVSYAPVLYVAYDISEHSSQSGNVSVGRTRAGVPTISTGNVESNMKRGKFKSKSYFEPYTNESFAPGNIADIKKALEMLRIMLDDCQFLEQSFDLSLPKEIAIWWKENATAERISPIEYSISLNSQLREIPIYGHAFLGMPGSMREGKNGEYFAEVGASLLYINESNISFGGNVFYEEEQIAVDIPLCSFNKIKATIESKIYSGNLRQVYEVKLGYALFNVPGATKSPDIPWRVSARYYAVPTWFVNCIYINDGKTPWSPCELDENAARSDPHSATLLINAQTGELYSRKKITAMAQQTIPVY